MFAAPWFIIGGIAAAFGAILIHLFHRRRFRVVHWAAMQFLLQAPRRSRRMIEVRDWLLLLLRVACLLLFAIGMARPHWGKPPLSGTHAATHLVLILDDTLSMSYETLGRSLWSEAQDRAITLVKELSSESRVSVVPLVWANQRAVRCEYAPPDEATEAIQSLCPLDQSGDLRVALVEAADLCDRFPEPRQKRIVILSDFQRSSSLGEDLAELAKRLPVKPEVILIQPETPQNTWVSRILVPERFVQPGETVRVRAWIRHEGTEPRTGIAVRLLVQGKVVASQPVDLLPGQEREVEFPPYSLVALPQETDLGWLDIQVNLPPDHLVQDDSATLLLPVFKIPPVLFVDQYGPSENPAAGRYGETYFLRKLLASSFEDISFGSVEQAHSLGELSPPLLENARVLVMAGVRDPSPCLPLLADFVRQGGILVLAAGGEFDPVAWSRAFEPPYELLPGRLQPSFVGQLPLPGLDSLQPFQLDVKTLSDPCFLIEGFDQTDLARFYQPVFFFQAVKIEISEESAETHQKRSALQKPAQNGTPDGDPRTANPSWLAWRWTLEREEIVPEQLQKKSANTPGKTPQKQEHSPPLTNARILARYTNGLPFMVERQLDRGRVIFISSGLFREWNTLGASYAVVVLDRLLRRLVESTCPRRNLGTGDVFRIAVDDPEEGVWQLIGPNGEMTPLIPEALGAQKYGIVIRGFPQRGQFHLIRYESSKGTTSGRHVSPAERISIMSSAAEQGARTILALGRPVDDIPLAVQGPPEESVPEYLAPEELKSQFGGPNLLGNGEGTDVTSLRTREWWPWFILAAVVGLVAEMGVLVRTSRPEETRPRI